MPAAAAPHVTVIPRKFLTVPGFDHRTFVSIKKSMARFRLITRKPLDSLDILTPKIEIKIFQLLIYCFLL